MTTPSPTAVRLRAALQQHKGMMTAILDSYGATNPRVFGSVARGDARETSDVDLLVDLLPGRGNELMRVAWDLGGAFDFARCPVRCRGRQSAAS